MVCRYQTKEAKEVIELLLNNGAKASINTQTTDGWTPLSLACYYQTKEVKEVLELLLNNGAKESINTQNTDGTTPLSIAFKNRDSQIVNLLLSKGAISDNKVEKS